MIRNGATYSRISGEHDERTASLDTQEAAAVALLQSLNIPVAAEHRFREQFTGFESANHRQVLLHLRELIATGTITDLACYDTDRLARDPADLMDFVVTAAERRGCKIHFVNAPHESTPAGRLLLYVRGFASEWEYQQIRDRTNRGRQQITAAGQVVGNGHPPYGYRWDKATRSRSEDPESARWVREIFHLVGKEGWSSNRVAKHLNSLGVPAPFAYRGNRYPAGQTPQWSGNTIRRIVRNETYIGQSTAGRYTQIRGVCTAVPRADWIVLSDSRTPPLIDPDLFRASAISIAAGHTMADRTRNERIPYLLRGHVLCAACGHRLYPAIKNQRRVYRCLSRYSQNTSCQSWSIAAGTLEDKCWDFFCATLRDTDQIDREVARLQQTDHSGSELAIADLAATNRQITAAVRRRRNLADAIADADVPAVRNAIKERLASLQIEHDLLLQSRDRIAARVEGFAAVARSAADLRDRIDAIRSLLSHPTLSTFADRRAILTAIHARFVVAADSVTLMLDVESGVIPAPASGNTSRNDSWAHMHFVSPAVYCP